MSLLKYIERLKRMDDLIQRKSTGSVEEFAEKLGISRSQLLQDLKELRELGAPIEFCPVHQSYKYTRECSLTLKMDSIKGGKNSFENFAQSSMAGLAFYNLATQGKLTP